MCDLGSNDRVRDAGELRGMREKFIYNCSPSLIYATTPGALNSPQINFLYHIFLFRTIVAEYHVAAPFKPVVQRLLAITKKVIGEPNNQLRAIVLNWTNNDYGEFRFLRLVPIDESLSIQIFDSICAKLIWKILRDYFILLNNHIVEIVARVYLV